MRNHSLHRCLLAPLALIGSLLAGCSGGGGSSQADGGFQLVSITVNPGQIWPINKRMELAFNAEVDLTSVIAGSTLQLRAIDGSGADAFFEVGFKTDLATGAVDKTTLVIQPFCPLLGDLSDAGLQPGGVEYELYVPGKSGLTPFTIESATGQPLELSQVRNFFTPDSFEPAVVFDDTEIGPPAFLPEETFVRLGDGTELPFVFDGTAYSLPTDLPLNLYSDPATAVSYLVQLNQAVDPSDANLSDDRVRLEYLDGAGVWQPFQTLVELEVNCPLDAAGALLRLTPQGILPQDAQIRVALVAGFTDLVGETSLSNQIDFFAPTQVLDFSSLTPSDGGADELFEDFQLSGTQVGSIEDTSATFDTPPAVWGDGEVTAAFNFQGTGGPGGDFDWHTPPGTIVFSTDVDSITGGPDGAPVLTIPVVNGVVDVDDLVLSANTTIRVAPGENPLTILATGTVRIEGTLDMTGFDAEAVGTLFTAWIPELGAVAMGGGGRGGTGSFLTSASTPRGGSGNGPFGIAGAGGQGGETGYSPSSDKQQRRGAGGGGGRFGPDFSSDTGMEAENGDPGNPAGFGAESMGEFPPQGGLAGNGPFTDADPDNNFWGRKGVYSGGDLVGLIEGELATPWAGYGSGAGGDALASGTFPTIPFGPPNMIDKKGCGGGAGGGQLRIIALGKIVFADGGRILVGGGDGATGENVLGFDHIAGSSGGGSGGHVILESATQVDFTDGGSSQVPQEFIQTYGGFGGIPHTSTLQWSGGGNGGPGVIQIHVPDANPSTSIGFSLTDNDIVLPILSNLGDLTRPTAEVLIPTFGARSTARSDWIPLGQAAQIPGGGEDLIQFTFGGTDPDPLSATAGQVETTGDLVDDVAAILGPETLGAAAPEPTLLPDGFSLMLSAGSLAPMISGPDPTSDMYLRNPSLLKNYILRMEGVSASQDFDVTSASYSDADVQLTVSVDASGSSLEAFVTGQGGPANVDYSLVPRFFLASTGGLVDVIPSSSYVQIRFQGTKAGAGDLPDEENPQTPWTPDIGELSLVPAGDLDFFRFEIEFNLDNAGAGLTVDTEPVSLRFLRMPFVF